MNNFDKSVKVCEALTNKKAINITVIDAAKVTSLADYFIFATATSATHAKALSDAAKEAIESCGSAVYKKEGYGSSDWVVIDCGDIIIHIMTTELRDKYNLEKLWNDGKNLKKFESIQKEIEQTLKKQEKKIVKDKKVQDKKDKKVKPVTRAQKARVRKIVKEKTVK